MTSETGVNHIWGVQLAVEISHHWELALLYLMPTYKQLVITRDL